MSNNPMPNMPKESEFRSNWLNLTTNARGVFMCMHQTCVSEKPTKYTSDYFLSMLKTDPVIAGMNDEQILLALKELFQGGFITLNEETQKFIPSSNAFDW